ncbi:MAG: 2,3-diaminopropionate biosynthesis protein SbnB [Catenulispora sp.]|nr:2,3-diaminopropionate biosynthesis protein SbnB [Catenulispora sp.]
MLIIGNAAVRDCLAGREKDVLDAVREAYRLHAEGATVVPFSTFLRFPPDDRNRIIGLPAYLGTPSPVLGLKWISSFPGNLAAGLARASAAIILNDAATGHPRALIEGAVISARRTAASAALATVQLGYSDVDTVALVGTGVINAEVLRFLTATQDRLRHVVVYDTQPGRAHLFAADHCGGLRVTVAATADEAYASARVICLATTATTPHTDLSACRPGSLILHLSLRDVLPETVAAARNVVDDIEHVDRERTSIHLAGQLTGHRDFIEATIGDLIRADRTLAPVDALTVFSPFGLGVLDLALAGLVAGTAEERGTGVRVPDFLG